jgi:hypothetical protein
MSEATTLKKNANTQDAVALLKADHRQVKKWFAEFDKARSPKVKQATIEEEFFYPSFLEATKDKDKHHEAAIEHDGAKKLIAEIEESDPSDDYFDSKVHVLSEMIKHHVKEEEQPGGMFAEAKDSKMDLVAIGQQMAARKSELMGESVN